MRKVEHLQTRAGPRMLDTMIDYFELDVLVTGPGILFQRLDFITNLSAFELIEKYVMEKK